METHGQQVLGFYDGDFTFHTEEHSDSSQNTPFRVRINAESPEERAHQNVRNYNKAPGGWERLRPSTDTEVNRWLAHFRKGYPLRAACHTAALRRLRLHGSVHVDDILSDGIMLACVQLCQPICRVREFQPGLVRFVASSDDRFRLTDEGLWLTSLMK